MTLGAYSCVCVQAVAMESRTLVPVLADEYIRPVELVDFYVSHVLDKRKTAEAVK